MGVGYPSFYWRMLERGGGGIDGQNDVAAIVFSLKMNLPCPTCPVHCTVDSDGFMEDTFNEDHSL